MEVSEHYQTYPKKGQNNCYVETLRDLQRMSMRKTDKEHGLQIAHLFLMWMIMLQRLTAANAWVLSGCRATI